MGTPTFNHAADRSSVASGQFFSYTHAHAKVSFCGNSLNRPGFFSLGRVGSGFGDVLESGESARGVDQRVGVFEHSEDVQQGNECGVATK